MKEFYILYYRRNEATSSRVPAWFRCYAKNEQEAYQQFLRDEENYRKSKPNNSYLFVLMVEAAQVIKSLDLLEREVYRDE